MRVALTLALATVLAAGCGGARTAATTHTTDLYPPTASCGVHLGDEAIIARTPYRDPRPACRAIVKTFAAEGERWRHGYGSATGAARKCRLIAPDKTTVDLTVYAKDDLCEELEERDWDEEE